MATKFGTLKTCKIFSHGKEIPQKKPVKGFKLFPEFVL